MFEYAIKYGYTIKNLKCEMLDACNTVVGGPNFHEKKTFLNINGMMNRFLDKMAEAKKHEVNLTWVRLVRKPIAGSWDKDCELVG